MGDIDQPNLTSIKVTPKTGNEHLTYNERSIGYSLLEFWQWGISDILSNVTRGRFAEFIVLTAVGINSTKVRNEWDAFDIETENGIRIEVKSAAYIQSWGQKDFSTISFSIKKSKHWDTNNGTSKDKPKRHADLYIFCLLKMKDQNIIDPLKLEQWEFYILPTFRLDNYQRSQTSITLHSLLKLTEAVNYAGLKNKIEKCYEEQVEYNKNVYNHL